MCLWLLFLRKQQNKQRTAMLNQSLQMPTIQLGCHTNEEQENHEPKDDVQAHERIMFQSAKGFGNWCAHASLHQSCRERRLCHGPTTLGV
jgi:hypothetical protein